MSTEDVAGVLMGLWFGTMAGLVVEILGWLS